LLTQRETRQRLSIRPHALRYQLFMRVPNRANSRI
jgi:hypothetical protein